MKIYVLLYTTLELKFLPILMAKLHKFQVLTDKTGLRKFFSISKSKNIEPEIIGRQLKMVQIVFNLSKYLQFLC